MQDCDSDIYEKIAYTSRQLNSSSTALPFFNLVVLCDLQQVEPLKVAILKCFDSMEVAYAYDKSAQAGELLSTCRPLHALLYLLNYYRTVILGIIYRHQL